MKYILTIFALALAACSQPKPAEEPLTLLIGTYTDATSEGIYSTTFDTATGLFSEVELVVEVDNPSYLAIDGDMLYTAIVLASTVVSVKIIDDFVIQPTLYSDRVQAHPLEIFLCILIAGTVAGVWGMLLAIPMYTVLRVFAREFFSEYSIVRKLTNQMTK
jgi:hypothetical protein